MLFRRRPQRPQPFTYHVPPRNANVVVSHNEPFETETIEMRRNVAAHPVSLGRKEGMRRSHWFEDEWDVRDRAGNGWKEHRSTQHR